VPLPKPAPIEVSTDEHIDNATGEKTAALSPSTKQPSAEGDDPAKRKGPALYVQSEEDSGVQNRDPTDPADDGEAAPMSFSPKRSRSGRPTTQLSSSSLRAAA